MKIAFDASDILGKSGIETYTRELISALADAYPDDTYILLTDAIQASGLSTHFAGKKNIVVDDCLLDIKVLGKAGRELIKRMNRKIWRRHSKHYDLVHQTNQFHMLKDVENLVTTVHDLIPLYEDTTNTASSRKRYKEKIDKLLTQSQFIIVPTDFVKSEFDSYFPGNSDKIKTVYEAAGYDFNPKPLDNSIFRKFDLPDGCRYFLHVGRLFERKNVLRIIEAYCMLKESLKKNSYLVLLVNGTRKEKKWLHDNEGIRILAENIKVIENTGFGDLVSFYNNAHGFLFPSLSEGFGLPVLEAMQCGCPVITSNISCLPEIAGNAAILVNPLETEEISKAMTLLLEDENKRKSLIKLGFQMASEFSWALSAQKTHVYYEEAMKLLEQNQNICQNDNCNNIIKKVKK